MKRAAYLLSLVILSETLGFLFSLGQHLTDPTWSAHAQFHLVWGFFWTAGLATVLMLIVWGPFLGGEPWTLWALLAAWILGHGGYFVAQLMVPASGRPQTLAENLSLLIAMLLMGIGLWAGWREMTKP